MSERSRELDALLSEKNYEVDHLPRSECRNCKDKYGNGLRLFKGRWHHIDMSGGRYYKRDFPCDNPQPRRCKVCGGHIDYKTTDVSYYDFMCESCITRVKDKAGDKIGFLTNEMKKVLASGTHSYLKYGTSCSVVLTKDGLFFEDTC